MASKRGIQWADLSETARDILEWTEHVHSGRKCEIRIEPGLPVSYSVPGGPTPVADKALADEIRAFVASDDPKDPDAFLMEEDGEAIKVTSALPEGSLLVTRGPW